jgi:hypothetical protein
LPKCDGNAGGWLHHQKKVVEKLAQGAAGKALFDASTAALRDFSPVFVRFGSKAAQMIGTVRRPMSALPPKADIARLSLYRAAVSSATATLAPAIARAVQELVQPNFETP